MALPVGPSNSGQGEIESGSGFSAAGSARDIVHFDDFISAGFVVDAGLSAESDPASKFSTIADAGEWLVTADVAPTIVVADGAVGGVLVITTGSNANDFCSLQMNGEAWATATNKTVFFEIRMKVDTAADARWFVGLCAEEAAGSAIGPILDVVGSAESMIGFIQNGDTTIDIDCLVQNAGTDTQVDTTVNILDDTFVILAFKVDGDGTVEFFVDGVLTITTTTNLPTADALTLSIEIHSPTASSVLSVDYIYCAQQR